MTKIVNANWHQLMKENYYPLEKGDPLPRDLFYIAIIIIIIIILQKCYN